MGRKVGLPTNMQQARRVFVKTVKTQRLCNSKISNVKHKFVKYSVKINIEFAISDLKRELLSSIALKFVTFI